jgi:flagellar biosynthesis/type III secretory pathway M-ring protein FliF/YscJ
MEANWTLIIIVIVAVISLIVFLIWRNQKDEKDLVKTIIDEDEKQIPKEHDSKVDLDES